MWNPPLIPEEQNSEESTPNQFIELPLNSHVAMGKKGLSRKQRPSRVPNHSVKKQKTNGASVRLLPPIAVPDAVRELAVENEDERNMLVNAFRKSSFTELAALLAFLVCLLPLSRCHKVSALFCAVVRSDFSVLTISDFSP